MPRRDRRTLALLLALTSLASCTGGGGGAGGTGTPAASPTATAAAALASAAGSASPSATPTLREFQIAKTTPLPLPGESGARAQHGGLLVDTADNRIVELFVGDGKAKVYLYNRNGEAYNPPAASGTLTAASSEGQSQKVTLARETDGPAVFLAGSAVLPATFDATLELTVDGEVHAAKVHYAAAGVPGSSAVPPGEQRTATRPTGKPGSAPSDVPGGATTPAPAASPQ